MDPMLRCCCSTSQSLSGHITTSALCWLQRLAATYHDTAVWLTGLDERPQATLLGTCLHSCTSGLPQQRRTVPPQPCYGCIQVTSLLIS